MTCHAVHGYATRCSSYQRRLIDERVRAVVARSLVDWGCLMRVRPSIGRTARSCRQVGCCCRMVLAIHCRLTTKAKYFQARHLHQ